MLLNHVSYPIIVLSGYQPKMGEVALEEFIAGSNPVTSTLKNQVILESLPLDFLLNVVSYCERAALWIA